MVNNRTTGTPPGGGEEREPVPLPSLRVTPGWASAILFLLAFVAVASAAFGTRGIRAALEGVVVGSVYVLGASGLSLTYAIKKFANFAHGDLMTAGRESPEEIGRAHV